MDLRTVGTLLDSPLFSTLQDMLDQFTEDMPTDQASKQQQANNPTRAYVRDAKAMARTPCDIKELPNAYQFVVDMPGVRPSEVKVQLEDDNVLVDRERGEEERESRGG